MSKLDKLGKEAVEELAKAEKKFPGLADERVFAPVSSVVVTR